MASALNCLDGLLTGEMSAIDGYRSALVTLDHPQLVPILHDCATAHQKRAIQLHHKINSLGARPSHDYGAWDAFTMLVDGTATELSDNVSIEMLEQGEDQGLAAYKEESQKCDDIAIRSFVQGLLLPGQEITHGLMRQLKQGLNSAAI